MHTLVGTNLLLNDAFSVDMIGCNEGNYRRQQVSHGTQSNDCIYRKIILVAFFSKISLPSLRLTNSKKTIIQYAPARLLLQYVDR